MLLPALGKSKDMARRMECTGNLRQIGIACSGYAIDNANRYPPGSQNPNQFMYAGSNGLGFLLPDYLGNPAVIVCPGFNLQNAWGNFSSRAAVANGGMAGYMYNGNPFTWNDFVTPSAPAYIGNGTMTGPDKIGPLGYGTNDAGAGMPSRVLLAYDVITETTSQNVVFHPHPVDRIARTANTLPIVDGGNGLFCDGHVKWLPVVNWTQIAGSMGGSGSYYQPGRNRPWTTGE